MINVKTLEPGCDVWALQTLEGCPDAVQKGHINTQLKHFEIFRVRSKQGEETNDLFVLQGHPNYWPEAELVTAGEIHRVSAILADTVLRNSVDLVGFIAVPFEVYLLRDWRKYDL